MRGMARLGDKCKGICHHPSHDQPIPAEGKIITSSDKVFCNGRGVARVGDTVRSDCGHEGKIITGMPTVFSEGRQHARLGDSFRGDFVGTIITASTDTF